MTAELADLFAPVVPESKFHPYFARLLKQDVEGEKAVPREWSKGFLDRDGKFVKEFQTSFSSGFWELYLHACLRHMGLDVDLSHKSPDFIVNGAAGPLALEAVVALNPIDLAPDWAQHGPAIDEEVDRDRLLALATLRLAQSISAKSDKWQKSYAKLPHCNDRAFVICVAPFEQPHSQLQGTQAIARVLFGEPQELIVDRATGKIVVGVVNLQETFKSSGAKVELGLFRDPRMAHVAGVLFSSLATWTKASALAANDQRWFVFNAVRLGADGNLRSFSALKADYSEGLVEGLHLFVNPFAARALDTAPWRAAGVGIHRLVGSNLEPESEVPDGMLVMRSCLRVNTTGQPVHPPGSPKASDFPRHEPGLPSDGVWFGGPAVLGTNDQVFLMLHRGWTICVGHEPIDDEWQYLVKRGKHGSLQRFIAAQTTGRAGEWLGGGFADRDLALQAARTWIELKGTRTWRSVSKRGRRN